MVTLKVTSYKEISPYIILAVRSRIHTYEKKMLEPDSSAVYRVQLFKQSRDTLIHTFLLK